MIGLLHSVPFEDVPPALRIRLCVSLANPDWKEEIAAAFEGRPPQREAQVQTRFVWRIHPEYGGKTGCAAVEVRPRFGSVMYWRFVLPPSSSVATWGLGPAGGAALSSAAMDVIEGTMDVEGTRCILLGAGDALSPSVSAYAVFEGQLPEFVYFGQAQQPLGPPAKLEVVHLTAHQPRGRD